MNLKFYLEKLENSEEYKKFMGENSDAFLCSGFFSIDKVGNDNKQHFDFCISSTSTKKLPAHLHSQINDLQQISSNCSSNKIVKSKIQVKQDLEQDKSKGELDNLNNKGKIFSFQLEDGIKFVPVEEFGGKVPEKVSKDCDFNFDYIEKLIAGEMFEKKIKNKVQKILLSLQSKDGKDFLIGTVFVSSMGLIKIKIDLSEMKVIDFEKKNFLDMVNIFKKNKEEKKD